MCVGWRAARTRRGTLFERGAAHFLWQAEKLLSVCQRAVPPFFEKEMGHFDVEQHPRYLDRLADFVHRETVAER